MNDVHDYDPPRELETWARAHFPDGLPTWRWGGMAYGLGNRVIVYFVEGKARISFEDDIESYHEWTRSPQR